MNNAVVVVIILIVLVAVVLGVLAARRRKSAQLQEHFGPEYERSVTAASGDRRAAEATLSERQQRRQEFDVRDLRPEERTRFRDSWNEIQRGFVDDPRQSLHSADLMVAEVMRTRGYPVDDDFDRRADDLSVDHPRVVQHYREARRVRDAGGEVDTENQRTAITSYRALVDALLGGDDDRRDDRRDDRLDERADERRDERRDDRLDERADERRDDRLDERADERRDDRLDDRLDERADDRYDDDRATGRTAAPTGDVVDERGDDRRTDRDGSDHTGTAATGRHALRDDQPRRDATGPADPNGPQGPRTEERTR